MAISQRVNRLPVLVKFEPSAREQAVSPPGHAEKARSLTVAVRK
jgi:hypothetical protein